MIYLNLFLTFLKIGAVAFGGGYAIIAMIRDECLAKGWLAEDEILNFIAVAESTPGPIAVNMATFVGSAQGGFFGAVLATFGVVLPAFVIILLVATVLTRLFKYAGVKAALDGIKPAIVALILSIALTMFLSICLGVKSVYDVSAPDYRSIIVFAVIATIYYSYLKIRKRPFSPILLILISGALGVILY